eukprot:3447607-Alexandrium_andersonii.AAC.1
MQKSVIPRQNLGLAGGAVTAAKPPRSSLTGPPPTSRALQKVVRSGCQRQQGWRGPGARGLLVKRGEGAARTARKGPPGWFSACLLYTSDAADDM